MNGPAPSLFCDHCRAPVAGAAVDEEIGGQERVFCCAGCRGAYRLIHDEGLDRYYERRSLAEVGPPAPSALDLSAFQAAVRESEGSAELELLEVRLAP